MGVCAEGELLSFKYKLKGLGNLNERMDPFFDYKLADTYAMVLSIPPLSFWKKKKIFFPKAIVIDW